MTKKSWRTIIKDLTPLLQERAELLINLLTILVLCLFVWVIS